MIIMGTMMILMTRSAWLHWSISRWFWSMSWWRLWWFFTMEEDVNLSSWREAGRLFAIEQISFLPCNSWNPIKWPGLFFKIIPSHSGNAMSDHILVWHLFLGRVRQLFDDNPSKFGVSMFVSLIFKQMQHYPNPLTPPTHSFHLTHPSLKKTKILCGTVCAVLGPLDGEGGAVCYTQFKARVSKRVRLGSPNG